MRAGEDAGGRPGLDDLTLVMMQSVAGRSVDSMAEAPGKMKLMAPLLVFGGPYSNLEATKALLAEACRRAVPPGNIVCTGDLAAYCADPQGVIRLLRRSGIRIVMGNLRGITRRSSPGVRLRVCRGQHLRGALRGVVSLCRPKCRCREPPLDGLATAATRVRDQRLSPCCHSWRRDQHQPFRLRRQQRGNRGGIDRFRLRRRYSWALRSPFHP
jgi:hypothetical protein